MSSNYKQDAHVVLACGWLSAKLKEHLQNFADEQLRW